MGLGTALKAFSAALFNSDAAKRIELALAGDVVPTGLPAPTPVPSAPPKPVVQTPARSEAITLLSTLQREARLIDLVYEDLSQFGDDQVGAAARPCLQQCRKSLDRILSVRPLLTENEGDTIEVGATPSPTRFQRVGSGNGSSAKIVHPGWTAAQVELPEWTGQDSDANVLAPAQVEG